MSVSVTAEIEGKSAAISLSGKLTEGDYEQFVPYLEGQIGRYGKINLLVELVEFEGWTAGALWQDTKFAAKHFNDIERLAIVGESVWERGMALFAKPFTTAEVRFFPPDRRDEAKEWIRTEEDEG